MWRREINERGSKFKSRSGSRIMQHNPGKARWRWSIIRGEKRLADRLSKMAVTVQIKKRSRMLRVAGVENYEFIRRSSPHFWSSKPRGCRVYHPMLWFHPSSNRSVHSGQRNCLLLGIDREIWTWLDPDWTWKESCLLPTLLVPVWCSCLVVGLTALVVNDDGCLCCSTRAGIGTWEYTC